MIKVKYEEYHNDYFRRNHEKTFSNLTDLENWMFDQMQQDYSESHGMYFPTPEGSAKFRSEGPSRIEFTHQNGEVLLSGYDRLKVIMGLSSLTEHSLPIKSTGAKKSRNGSRIVTSVSILLSLLLWNKEGGCEKCYQT